MSLEVSERVKSLLESDVDENQLLGANIIVDSDEMTIDEKEKILGDFFDKVYSNDPKIKSPADETMEKLILAVYNIQPQTATGKIKSV